MTSQLILLATAAALSILLIGMTAYAWRRKRMAQAAKSIEADSLLLILENQERMGDVLTTMSDEMKDIRSDIQWLTSERMIDQAISMAREGESGSEIVRQTGISADELVAMQAFRKH